MMGFGDSWRCLVFLVESVTFGFDRLLGCFKWYQFMIFIFTKSGY